MSSSRVRFWLGILVAALVLETAHALQPSGGPYARRFTTSTVKQVDNPEPASSP